MKLNISQSSLLKALSIVSKGAGLTATLPVLNSVKITALGGDLELQTTDLNIAIKHIVPADVEEEGSVLVSLKTLHAITKTLPDASVSLKTTEAGVTLSCEQSVFSLLTLNVEEFPAFPEYQITNSVSLSVGLLNQMVERTYKITSKDVTRPILNGILLTVNNNTVRLVAVDSHRLAVCDTNVETSSLAKEFSLVVPGQVFHDVLSIAQKEDQVTIGATESQIIFSFANTAFLSRKIEGSFPNYKQLLPQTSKTSFELPLEGFSEALRRVSSIISQNPSVRFEINAEDNAIIMSTANQEAGKAKEEIPVNISGESVVIALNNHYIADGIAPLLSEKEEKVTVELQDSTQPAIFKSFGKINYLYLLMSIRI